jgi:hypothetical protein
MKSKYYINHILLFFSLFTFILVSNCGIYKKDSNVPIQGEERARKNIEEGRGMSMKGLVGGGKTNYEFSSSNPMWRASLEILDFLPLSTVDYSGGVLITDWYNDTNSSNESIKITIRFLSNEIATNNLKVIVHKKVCETAVKCTTNEIKSKISEELQKNILQKAALLDAKNKKKN